MDQSHWIIVDKALHKANCVPPEHHAPDQQDIGKTLDTINQR